MSRVVALAATALVLAGVALPVSAHPRIAVGMGFGGPAWPPPGALVYPAVHAFAPTWVVERGVPPPGWEPGRWEWQRDFRGRRYPVWTPPHLR